MHAFESAHYDGRKCTMSQLAVCIMSFLVCASLISALVCTIFYAKKPLECEGWCKVLTRLDRGYWSGGGDAGGQWCFETIWKVDVCKTVHVDNETICAVASINIQCAAHQQTGHLIGSIDTCWYDCENVKSVEWEKPPNRNGLLIGLTVLWILFGCCYFLICIVVLFDMFLCRDHGSYNRINN